MNPMFRALTHDLDKIILMRRVITQRTATRDCICLGQLPALRYINEHPGCTQKDVADFIKVSPPSVAVMVKRMVRDGFVEKTADEHDMRQNRLTITESGRATAERCRSIFGQMDEQVYAGFSDEELEQLSSYLKRLIDNMASDEVRSISNFSLMQMVKSMECSGASDNKSTSKEE